MGKRRDQGIKGSRDQENNGNGASVPRSLDPSIHAVSAAVQRATAAPAGCKVIALELTVWGEPLPGYAEQHRGVQLYDLTPRQSAALGRYFKAVHLESIPGTAGRRVETPSRAVQLILDKMADAMGI